MQFQCFILLRNSRMHLQIREKAHNSSGSRQPDMQMIHFLRKSLFRVPFIHGNTVLMFMQSQPLFFKISRTSAILLSGTSNRISMIFLAQIPESRTSDMADAYPPCAQQNFQTTFFPPCTNSAHSFMRHKKYGKQLPQFFQTLSSPVSPYIPPSIFQLIINSHKTQICLRAHKNRPR